MPARLRFRPRPQSRSSPGGGRGVVGTRRRIPPSPSFRLPKLWRRCSIFMSARKLSGPRRSGPSTHVWSRFIRANRCASRRASSSFFTPEALDGLPAIYYGGLRAKACGGASDSESPLRSISHRDGGQHGGSARYHSVDGRPDLVGGPLHFRSSRFWRARSYWRQAWRARASGASAKW